MRGFTLQVRGEADAAAVEVAAAAATTEQTLVGLGPNLVYTVVVAAVTADGAAESEPAQVGGRGCFGWP